MSSLETILSGVGGYLPERVVTNHDLAKFVDTTDEWIKSRSGIAQRHFAADDQATSDLATEASRRAIEQAGLSPEDIGLIIIATVTPDKTFPSTAVFVQEKLGVPPGIAFDVSAACSGFLYGVNIAHNFIASGQVKHALVVGAEKLTCFLDWEDRGTCVLFGDGAGAVVLSGREATAGKPREGVLQTYLSADGRMANDLYADGGPSTSGTVGKVRMNGREVFRHAVDQISGAVKQVADAGNVSPQEIDWFVPHQANIRIIDSCAKRLKLDSEKIIVTIDRHGNTSSASIPLALDEGIRDGRIKRGQLLAFAALGGGLAWGSALIRY